MNNFIDCTRCGGEGYSYYDEREPCYHCSTSGRIDADTAYRDRVESLAYKIAYNRISALRQEINESDPEYGEGWDFHAAESMMSPYDYFMVRVEEEAYYVGQELDKMSEDEVDFLLAWKEYPWENNVSRDVSEDTSEPVVEKYYDYVSYEKVEPKSSVDFKVDESSPDYIPF